MYEGCNAANVDVTPEAVNLPTMHKAVVTAIIKSGISQDPDGMHDFFEQPLSISIIFNNSTTAACYSQCRYRTSK